MEIVLCVILSVLASMLATKIQTAKYFNVIDEYVKGLISDISTAVRDAAGNK